MATKKQKARSKALAEGMTTQDLVAKLLTEYLKKGGKYPCVKTFKK